MGSRAAVMVVLEIGGVGSSFLLLLPDRFGNLALSISWMVHSTVLVIVSILRAVIVILLSSGVIMAIFLSGIMVLLFSDFPDEAVNLPLPCVRILHSGAGSGAYLHLLPFDPSVSV